MKLFFKSISNIFSNINLINQKNNKVNIEYENLPKKIYVYWHDGFESLPPIVQLCLQLLEELNPEYELVKIDKTIIKDISKKVSVNFNDIPIQAISDIVRVYILKQYGGIWVDVTVLPVIPFKSWLPKNIKKGFFAFRCHHAPYALISSWFLVSNPNHKIIEYWFKSIQSFWTKRRKLIIDPRNGDPTPRYPLYEVVQNADNIDTYPYFWSHYLFTDMILSDSNIRQIWDFIPVISSTPLHTFQNYLRTNNTLCDKEVTKILEHSILEKLDWRLQNEDLSIIYEIVMRINKK